MQIIEAGPFEYVDKLPLKKGYKAAGVRVVPGASARFGAYLAPTRRDDAELREHRRVRRRGHDDRHVGDGRVRARRSARTCTSSGGVGIGGVLEPAEAAPVVVEDDCFVGSRCMIVNGARVRKGAKLGAGLILTSNTPVIDSDTGEEIARGVIPERAVVVQGTRMKEFTGGTFGLPCALILRTLAEGEEHDKLKLNALLREHDIVS